MVVHNHRKIEKSRRRRLLRRYKKDREEMAMNIKLLYMKNKSVYCRVNEDNLWDVLDSNYLFNKFGDELFYDTTNSDQNHKMDERLHLRNKTPPKMTLFIP
jgi:hypothetical protein